MISNPILAILTFRTFLTFAATAFALAVVMLALNIITPHDLATILGIAGTDAEVVLTKVVINIQQVLSQILSVISQLLNKVLSWAGVDVDLSKIKIETNAPAPAPAAAPTPPATGSEAYKTLQ